MFIIKLANISIKINNHYNYVYKLCNDYLINDSNYDIEININKDDIEYEKKIAKETFSLNYLESIAVYRKITNQLLDYDCFLLHGSILKVDNVAYGFSAPSGTGKTTHTMLWQKLLKDKCVIINGDKPLIRIIDHIPYAYGTPWNGKEGYGTNTFAALKSLCFLEQAKNNEISILPKEKILPKLASQIIIPKDIDALDKTFNLVNEMLNYTKCYLLKCNMDISSAELSYNYMKEKIDD